MKKFILIFIAMFLSVGVFGQSTKPIEFMGIPVDGTVANMKSRLVAKGFRYDATLDRYTGEFNGKNVKIHVLSNKGKVWRIAVIYYETSNQRRIKDEYNILLRQFKENDKYWWVDGEEIPEDEYLSSYKIEEREYTFTALVDFSFENYAWAMIGGEYGEYIIYLFYDNENNKANGEDL